jgi:hypothetical protein
VRRKDQPKKDRAAIQSYTYKFALRWIAPDGRPRIHGAPPPEAAAQLAEYGRYYNNRIEIARASRLAYREARTALVPAWAAAETALVEADAALVTILTEASQYKAAMRTKALPPELRGRLEAARTAKTLAKRAFTEAKAAAQTNDALTAKATEIAADRNRREKEVRATTPLYWGSYLRAEEAAQAAEATSSNLPKFRRWYSGLPVPEIPRDQRTPEGTIAVQIQSTKPLRVAELYASDSRIQLVRSGKYTRGRIRIGSTGPGNREPVWADFSAHINREMPADAMVTGVAIKRERLGAKYRHWLYVAVDRAAPIAKPAVGTIGIDVNMRAVAGGIRVAVTYDGLWYREWVLPQAIADKTHHAHEIQSTRDQNFNEAKARLATFIASRETVPEWLVEATKWLPQWRDHGKLAALVLDWRTQQFDGDGEVLAELEGWRKHDRHLLEYATHEAEGARGRRLALYREWAAEWMTKHDAVIPSYDWAMMAALPWPGDDDEIPAAVRKRRHNVVSPDALLQAIRHAARSRGRVVVEAMPAIVCGHCSGSVKEDKETGRITCTACHLVGSRDEAQARGLWDARERPSGAGGSGSARASEVAETTGTSGGAGRATAGTVAGSA